VSKVTSKTGKKAKSIATCYSFVVHSSQAMLHVQAGQKMIEVHLELRLYV